MTLIKTPVLWIVKRMAIAAVRKRQAVRVVTADVKPVNLRR
jgi:hypothetical protein